MIQALRYEWVRITTLRSTWWISFGTVLVASGLTFLVCMFLRISAGSSLEGDLAGEEARVVLDSMMTQFSNLDPSFYLVAYIVAIVGILAWGHEYRHGMIRATLTAVPVRWAVWTAKYAVIGAWVSVIVVASCLMSLGVALLWFADLEVEIDLLPLLASIGWHVVYTVLLTWLVMSLTVLVRHQTFALVALYLWPMGVESLVKGMLVLSLDPDVYNATRFLPFNAGGRIVQRVPEAHDVLGVPLSAGGGLLVFGGFTAALMLGSFVRFRVSDA